MAQRQHDLFGASEPVLPAGFSYQDSVITAQDEEALLADFAPLPFKEFEFHGFLGKRRVVSFGWRYDFSAARLQRVNDIPDFLAPVRDKAARFARLPPDALKHALITEYAAGAAIGWHRDRSVFGDVIGVSLLSPCTFRLRRKTGAKWERISLTAQPRSAYILRGPSRTEWEHSIPGVPALRYSITFRTLKAEDEERLSQT